MMLKINEILASIHIECDDAGAVNFLTWGKDVEPVLIGNNAANVRNQIEEYLQGDRKFFDVEVSFKQGTEFQRKIWSVLHQVPYGETRTYKDLADAVGSHPRAIGGAMGRNPIPIIVPCHRILSKSGLGGFSAVGGTNIKTELLALEKITLV